MFIRIFIVALVFWGPGLAAQADIVVYNFDDGTDQGWTNVLTSPGDEPIAYEASSRSDASAPGHSGIFRVLPKISGAFSPTEDSPHKTLVFRSPEFVVNADTSINFFMNIGAGGALTPGPDFSSLAPNSASNGFLGLGVRRVSDGAYVLFARRSANNGNWEEFTFDSTTLSGNSLIGETLTLDLIDQHNGGFGWVALDTVTLNNVTAVPEPSSLSMLVVASLFGIGFHRRRKRLLLTPTSLKPCQVRFVNRAVQAIADGI